MKYPVITERAYREWPDDHPFKQKLPVLPDNMLDAADVLVCSIKGEPRTVPASDDHDVEATCHKCGVAVVHRASAPDLPKECWRCFAS